MANTWGWMCRPQHSTIKLITRNTLSYYMADPESSEIVIYTHQWPHLSVTLLNISQQLQQVRYHIWYELNDNNYMKSTVPRLLLYAHTYRGKIFSCEGKIIYSWCVLSRSPVLPMYNNTWKNIKGYKRTGIERLLIWPVKSLIDATHYTDSNWPITSHWGAIIGVNKSKVMDVILLTFLLLPTGRVTTQHDIVLANIYKHMIRTLSILIGDLCIWLTFDPWFLIPESVEWSTIYHNLSHHIVHRQQGPRHDTLPLFQTAPGC